MNAPGVDLDLVRGLEERCLNAWPALRTLAVDGWIVRLSDGHTRRANSATPLYRSAGPLGARIDLVEAVFRAAGLTPVVRVTPLAGADVAPELARRGWAEDDPSGGFFAPAPPPVWSARTKARLRLDDRLSEDWLAPRCAVMATASAARPALRRMLPLIALPHVYATLLLDEAPVAFGLAVAERGMVGLYDLVVDPAARGQGLGRALVEALWRWGVARGAGAAYLQVRVSNVAARALYASLGLREVYRYVQLVAPDVSIGRDRGDARSP
ncbi:MAG: GNAT family N-acetyltransferase [Rhodoblastus sp.]|nr:MAG: GNAT family N-acetyltransferase [Rhodoblastus sp.]